MSANAEPVRPFCRRRLRGWLLAGVLAAAATAAAEPRVGLAVEGFDRARLLAPAGARVEDYANAGYRLRVDGGEVRVEVDAAALASSSRFIAPRRDPQAGGPIDRLARGLTAGADTRYEAISRVLGWVAGAIAYDLDRGAPQDSAAVLRRRSGYCTGVARLTVALLRAAGIPAREVPGYVVGGAPGRGGGYHRWIEAFLPDRGWVFSDPLTSHHYVPATYLRLAAEELDADRGVAPDAARGLLLERREALQAVDPYPHGVPGITARRNSERQLAAALSVRLEATGSGMAELVGRSQRRRRPLVDGGAAFVGLLPGSYRLRLTLADAVIERPVELTGRVRKSLWIPGRLSAPKR